MQVIKRNSSIELLKIVAVFLIVLSHSLPVNNSEAEWYINIKSATSNVSYISMLFFSYCGQIGNEIFFICSAWFLVDYYNRGGRIKFDKIKNIVIETVFVSYLYLFITTVVLKQHVSGFMILESLLPISTEHYWFITAYLFFNIFCPILHMYLINCERKQQRKVCMFIIIVYMIAGNLIPLQGDLYFCNKVIMFLGLYACVFYIKETKMNFSKPVLGIGILLFLLIGEILLTEMIGLKVNVFSNQMNHWATMMNPIVFLMCMLIFQVFSNINYYSKLINVLSSMSLLVYLFTANSLYSVFIRTKYFDLWYRQFGNISIQCCIGLACIQLVYGLGMSVLYKQCVSKGKSIMKMMHLGK